MIAIEVNELRLKFPGDPSLVFKDLSLSIQKGEKVLFLGPSGCGKSTLLQVLSGLIPNSIEVPMKYESIQIPVSYGYVFQDPDTQFCMPYVDEELAFVLENMNVPRDKMEEKIRDALSLVCLNLTDLHTPIVELSQGMKQRLALACTLLLSPEVLFLDEPSALLDVEGTKQIWDSVKQIAGNKTVVIVEHKIDYIMDWIDRLVIFNADGQIIADGPPKEVFVVHHAKLVEYGIWYPAVWEDYTKSDAYELLIKAREYQLKQTEQAHSGISLRTFAGYRNKEEKISVADASVSSGDWVVVTGENGAGKSTLLLALTQLIQTSGDYYIDNEQINWHKKENYIPAGFSLVFQNPEMQFVTHSVLDEVQLTVENSGKGSTTAGQTAEQILKVFELDRLQARHPYALSMGQKRRLSVASALQPSLKCLLLDEPTFGQDARNTFSILEQIEHIRLQGVTIIMVTHDMNIVNYFATKHWKVEKGRLLECPLVQKIDLLMEGNSYA